MSTRRRDPVTALVEDNLDLAAMAANKVVHGSQHWLSEEIHGAARVALWEAAKRYDSTRDATFRTYAWHRCLGAARDEIRRLTCKRRVGMENWTQAASLDVIMEDNGFEQAADVPEFDLTLIAQEDARRVARAISTLDPRLIDIVASYYYEHQTMVQIGQEWGVTESRVSQLMKEAHAGIKLALENEDARATQFEAGKRRNAKVVVGWRGEIVDLRGPVAVFV